MSLSLTTLTDPSSYSGSLEAATAMPYHGEPVPLWTNSGVGASDPLQAIMTNEPIYRPWSATKGNYLSLPAIANNTSSIPSEAALDFAGADLDFIAKWAKPETLASSGTICGRRQSGNTFNWNINSNGTMLMTIWCNDASTRSATSSAAMAFPYDGWVRVTVDMNNGASGVDFKFYTSDDGVSWSQLGATQTVATAAPPLAANSSPLWIGSATSSVTPLAGQLYRVIIKNGIGGSTVADVDFNDAADHASSFTCSTGQTVTIYTNENIPAAIIGFPQVWFDTDNYLAGGFSSSLGSARSFIIARSLGNGGEVSGRLFSAIATGGIDTDPSGIILGYNSGGNLNTYWSGADRTVHTGGFTGLFMLETHVSGTDNYSRINNSGQQAWSADASALDSYLFAVGGRASDGTANPSVSIYEIAIYDPGLFDDTMRNEYAAYLNNKYSIY